MSKWLIDTKLSGDLVTLVPLQLYHKETLIEAALDGKLWEFWYTVVPSLNTVDEYIAFALREEEALPFVVIENAKNKVIGSTRYLQSQTTVALKSGTLGTQSDTNAQV